MKTTNKIIVRFTIDAIHKWDPAHVGKEPPTGYEFLTHPHRHKFHWTVTYRQNASRELEFLHVQELSKFLAIKAYNRLPRDGQVLFASCEDMANEFLASLERNQCEGNAFAPLFAGIDSVEVSEDGENGALITVVPDQQMGGATNGNDERRCSGACGNCKEQR
jgi:hypothetical protein